MGGSGKRHGWASLASRLIGGKGPAKVLSDLPASRGHSHTG